MTDKTNRLHFRLLASLALAASLVLSPSSRAERPAHDESDGVSYIITDQEVLQEQEVLPTSEVVWGTTSIGYRECDFARAGCPQCLRKITIPSNTRFNVGYYVGGGTPTKGTGRCIKDGTWGWDHSGILFPKRIALNWTAKGRVQGGTGAYKTDGPMLRQ